MSNEKFKVGDEVVLARGNSRGKGVVISTNNPIGTLSVKWDDGMPPSFMMAGNTLEYAIKSPEDLVTITTTYGELAKAYAVFGTTNGHPYGESLFGIARGILDPEQKIYDQFFYVEDEPEQREDYVSYQEDWLKVLFKEYSNNKEKQEIINQIETLQTRLKELEGRGS